MSEPAVLYEAKDFIATITLNRPENRNSMTEDVFEGLRASIARVMPDGSHVAPGKKALVVELTLENRSGESSNIYGDVLKVENVPDLSKPYFYLTRDRELLWDVQPMMPERVRAVWQVPQDQPLPPQVRLAVSGAIFKPRLAVMLHLYL